METVGLFDAKTHFSEYVARAEAGEEVIITRHNKPVAKIVPFAQPANSRKKREVAIQALLRSAQGRTLGMDWRTLRDEGRR